MINIVIDPKLVGCRARCREPSPIFITRIVLENGALCMKGGSAPGGRVRLIQSSKEVEPGVGSHLYVFLWWREAALHAVLMAPLLIVKKSGIFGRESHFFEVARKARGEEEETTIS